MFLTLMRPSLVLFLVLFFFFQAEDGIRDGHVTGVQTCALPISETGVTNVHHFKKVLYQNIYNNIDVEFLLRSEERRVGKSVYLGGGRIIKRKKKSSLRWD